MGIDYYREYINKFRKTPTATLKKKYHGYNAQFKAIAREEFKKRGVSKKSLPYKTKRRQSGFGSISLFGR